MNSMVRQGDFLLVKIDSEPNGEFTVHPRVGNRVIVGYGEVTGHHHAIADKSVELRESGDMVWIVAPNEFTLVHEEHAPLKLDAGIWRVIQQVEYTPQELRKVID